MRFIVALAAILMLFTSLGFGGSASAAEAGGCMDAAVGSVSVQHADCGMTEAPADAHKGYPHLHGTCHGHHVMAQAESAPAPIFLRVASAPAIAGAARLRPADTEIALKPPRA